MDVAVPARASGLSILRRVLGVLAAAGAVVALVLYALGAWNPWRYVALTQHFGNPPRGSVIVAALAFVAAWLLAPVRNEAAQGLRVGLRVITAVGLAVALICSGVLGNVLGADVRVLSRSADGERAVALLHRTADDRELRVWAGAGLTARDVGRLGKACGEVTARFLSRDEVEVDSSYGVFRFQLDPRSGAPLSQLGDSCTG